MGRKEKILSLAKGYRGRGKNCITVARARVEKVRDRQRPAAPPHPPLLTLLCPRAQGLQYAYRDRRTKKREFRSLWISRINAGAREHGYSYSRFTHGQNQAGIVLNRKILAELAVYEPWSFKSIVDVVRASEEAGTDSEQSSQMQQDLILDRISMAAADPAEAKERLGAYNS